ncbi:uncharacterized protein BJ212DRAFT_1335131, partial [Suillus subaureus]
MNYEHHLANQALPPIERLCEPIEGTDKARLAELLGERGTFVTLYAASAYQPSCLIADLSQLNSVGVR